MKSSTTAKRQRPPQSRTAGPFPGWEVPCSGAQVKRGRPSSRCVRYGRQRSVRTARGATTQTPRGEGASPAVVNFSPSSCYSTSASKSPVRSPSDSRSHEANLGRASQLKDYLASTLSQTTQIRIVTFIFWVVNCVCLHRWLNDSGT